MPEDKKHTPLPWAFGSDNRVVPADLDIEYKTIADCDGYGDSVPNAMFIVRACNSHYELLGMVKVLRELTASKADNESKLKIMDKLIAKAEGK